MSATEVPTAVPASFSPVIANIRSALEMAMGDQWTTQIVDDSRPEEACAGRPHVNVAVPSEGSGAVRSVAQSGGAVVSVLARRYGSPDQADEALEYVAVTNVTDCNPFAVNDDYEDFLVAESVDDDMLRAVDGAMAWATYRRAAADPDDVLVVAYSAIYRVGVSLATITGRVEVAENESPDDAVLRARELQSTAVPTVIGELGAG